MKGRGYTYHLGQAFGILVIILLDMAIALAMFRLVVWLLP